MSTLKKGQRWRYHWSADWIADSAGSLVEILETPVGNLAKCKTFYDNGQSKIDSWDFSERYAPRWEYLEGQDAPETT